MVARAQHIGLAIFHLEELGADRIPERRLAFAVGEAADLRHRLRAEADRIGRDQHQPRERQQPPTPAAARLALDEQRAELGVAVIVVDEEQQVEFDLHALLRRDLGVARDAVGIEGPLDAEIGEDAGGAQQFAVLLHHQEIAFVLRRQRAARESRKRALDPRRHRLARGWHGQHARIDARDHRLEPVEVAAGGRADDCVVMADGLALGGELRQRLLPEEFHGGAQIFRADAAAARRFYVEAVLDQAAIAAGLRGLCSSPRR